MKFKSNVVIQSATAHGLSDHKC